MKWYVAPQTGNDSNDGKSKETAVKTFRHLLSLMPLDVEANTEIVWLENTTPRKRGNR
jgi:hypothetical protein